MTQRTRNLFLTWLAYGALQLVLLGAPGADARPGVGNRGVQSQSEVQSVALGKRLLGPELGHRRTPTTPFVPSSYVRLELPATVGRTAQVGWNRQAVSVDPVALPPARAPPASL
jgi:hypothetical protein